MTEPNDMEAMDLRSRIVTAEHRGSEHAHRLTALEAWQQQSAVSEARKDEQFKHMDTRFSTLDAKIDAVNGTLSWINKLLIGAVLMAAVAFMVNGGLKLPL